MVNRNDNNKKNSMKNFKVINRAAALRAETCKPTKKIKIKTQNKKNR